MKLQTFASDGLIASGGSLQASRAFEGHESPEHTNGVTIRPLVLLSKAYINLVILMCLVFESSSRPTLSMLAGSNGSANVRWGRLFGAALLDREQDDTVIPVEGCHMLSRQSELFWSCCQGWMFSTWLEAFALAPQALALTCA